VKLKFRFPTSGRAAIVNAVVKEINTTNDTVGVSEANVPEGLATFLDRMIDKIERRVQKRLRKQTKKSKKKAA
jgi:hypothetical protein